MSLRSDSQPVDTEQVRGLATHVEPRSGRIPTTLDALELARIAEHAHGLAGEQLALIQTQDGDVLLKKRGDVADTEIVVFEVETALRQPNRLKLEKLVMKAEGCEEDDIGNRYDSLFWSESAFEKFLLPYYHAQRVLTDEQIRKLTEGSRSREVVAIGHLPSTHEELISGIDPSATGIEVLVRSGTITMAGEEKLVRMSLQEYLSRATH